MTLEQLIPYAGPVFVIALLTGILCELVVKPALDAYGMGKDEQPKKRAVILNGIALLLSFAFAAIWAVVSDTISAGNMWAVIIIQGAFATGLAILGYEGITNVVKFQRGD